MNLADRDLWIKKYTEGRLSPEEKATFESLLQGDAGLAQEVQEYGMIARLVKEQKLIQIKNIAARTQARQEQAALRKKVLIGTAVLLGLLAGAWLGYNLYENNKPQDTLVPKIPEIAPPDFKKQTSDTPEELPDPAVTQTTLLPKPSKEEVGYVSDVDTVKISRAMPQTHEALVTESTGKPSVTAQHPPEQVIPKDGCAGVQLKAEIHSSPACTGKSDGSISIGAPQGGKAPYTVQVFTEQKQLLSQTTGLEAGMYLVLLSDAQQCGTGLSVKVAAQACSEHYSFNPALGETWEIPSQGKKGQLKIVDKKGNLYFSRNLAFSEVAHWDGKPNNGEVKTGYYLFYIQHEDNTIISGSVTIIE